MSFIKYFLLLAAILGCNYGQAQQFDSVKIDTPALPTPVYVRIKFPHSGFTFKDYAEYPMLSDPGFSYVNFLFEECKGTAGTSHYDTTLSIYVAKPYGLMFSLFLDSNTTDTNCVIRATQMRVDSLWITIEWPFPNAVAGVEEAQTAIYPNPVTNHKVFVETHNRLTNASLYSMQGSLLASYPLGGDKAEIDLPPHIVSGNYLLYLKMANGSTERQIITVQ